MRRSIATALRLASAKTDRNPSDAMKAAGNYAKGKLAYNGMTIAIENPKGSVRSGKDANGKEWRCTLPAAYGYLLNTTAIDSDHVDCYVGPDHDSDKVWVIDQVDAKTKKYDEPKCMLSFASKADAIKAYEKAFSDGKGKDRVGAVTELSVEDFRKWAHSPAAKKPLGSDIKRAAGGAVPPFPGDVPGYASGGSPSIEAIIQAAATQYGIDPAIMRAFAGIESGYDPMSVKGKYRGLYQMSSDEFGKYGGSGNIFDPVENANAAARKFQADIAAFNKQYGRDPTAGELYERHQQGVGGAGAHWARPEAPAWQNMYSTLEGRQKGPGWSRDAISGNMLPEWKKQYDPNTITSGQFTQLWNDRVNKFAGLPGTASEVPAGFGGASAPKDAQPVGLTSVAPVASDMSTPRTYPGDTFKSPEKTNTSGSWLSNLFGGNHPEIPDSSKSADWVEGPLGLMPKWSDGSTAFQPLGFAAGGATTYPGDDPDFLSMLKNNPHGWGNSPAVDRPVQEQEPWNFPAEARNMYRPEDPLTPAYEAASPAVSGYSLGQGIGEVAGAINAGEYKNAALAAAPLLMGMALPVPGVKGVRRFANPEIDERGFISPSLEASKYLPQETGTVGQMRAALLGGVKDPEGNIARGKEKELAAIGFDAAFPDPAAKVSRGQIEEFLRGNRVGLGTKTHGGAHNAQLLDRTSRDAFDRPFNDLGGDEQGEVRDMVSGLVPELEPRYESHSTPGGIPGSYREVVTTLPTKTPNQAGHDALVAKLSQKYGGARGTDLIRQLTPEETAKVRSFEPGGKQEAESQYTSSHWPGVTNPLLHYRTKDFITPTDILGQSSEKVTQPNSLGQPSQGLGDRTVAGDNTNGSLNQNKVRVLDELQSDWAQRARDQGTRDPAAAPGLRAEWERASTRKEDAYDDLHSLVSDQTGSAPGDIASLIREAQKLSGGSDLIAKFNAAENDMMDLTNKIKGAESGVPSAPFISNTSDWVDLGLKQVLSDAVKDPSVTRLAWAPGGVQADRYNMSAHIDGLNAFRRPDGNFSLTGKAKNSSVYGHEVGTAIPPNELANYVGRDLAQKMLEQKPGSEQVYSGLDLKVGGEGHKGFYGDFTPEGSYNPGIVGTRLLKILKGMDPDAKIEPHHIRNIKGSNGWSGGEGEGSFQDFLKSPIPADKPVHYPSVAITPKMREAIRKGLPLFLALGAAGIGEKGSEDDDRFQEWLDKGQQ